MLPSWDEGILSKAGRSSSKKRRVVLLPVTVDRVQNLPPTHPVHYALHCGPTMAALRADFLSAVQQHRGVRLRALQALYTRAHTHDVHATGEAARRVRGGTTGGPR
jgi:inactivated superfamily I helicase